MPVSLTKLLIYIVSSMLLLACGGGGGGGGGGDSSSEASSNEPPANISPSELSFSNHRDINEKITLVYPSTWSREPNNDVNILAIFAEPLASGTDSFSENVALVKFNSSAETTATGVSNIQEISSSSRTVAGFSGVEAVFDADVAGAEQLDLRFMEIYFEFQGFVYGLLYSAEKSVFDKNAEVVRYMADSLDIGQIILSNLKLTSDLTAPGRPGIATDGNNFLVVSCRDEAIFPARSQLIANVIYADRSSLSSEIVLEAAGDNGCPITQTQYDVVFDGVNYLVVYTDNLDVLAKRVDVNGLLVDSGPIDISQSAANVDSQVALGFDGTNTLVAWQQASQILGALIDSSGSVGIPFVIESDVTILFPEGTIDQFRIDVAYGNNQFLIVWNPLYSDESKPFHSTPIYGQLVDLTGTLILANPLEIRSDIGDTPRYPQVSFDGINYLVAWIEGALDSVREYNLYGRKVTSLGLILNGSAADTGVLLSDRVPSDSIVGRDSKDFLNLTYNNGNYFAMWSAKPEIYGFRISSDLNQISAPIVLAGKAEETFGGFSNALRHPNIAYSSNQSLTVWPSTTGSDGGVVEGWFFDYSEFD
jgi:hypothetical protein